MTSSVQSSNPVQQVSLSTSLPAPSQPVSSALRSKYKFRFQGQIYTTSLDILGRKQYATESQWKDYVEKFVIPSLSVVASNANAAQFDRAAFKGKEHEWSVFTNNRTTEHSEKALANLKTYYPIFEQFATKVVKSDLDAVPSSAQLPTITRPFIPNQPVGLINSGNNCWLNATLQQFMANEHLKGVLRAFADHHRRPNLQRFITEYDAAIAAQQPVLSMDTQLIRSELAALPGSNFQAVGTEEDPSELYNFIMNNVPDTYRDGTPAIPATGTQAAVGAGPASKAFSTITTNVYAPDNSLTAQQPLSRESLFVLPLGNLNALPQATQTLHFQPFFALMDQYFTDTIYADGAVERVVKTRFANVPEQFSLQYGRFAHDADTDQATKIDTPVNTPLYLDLGDPSMLDNNGHHKYLETNPAQGEDLRYELTSIIEHLGQRDIHHGHIIAYTKKDGRWYKEDDRVVQEVSADEAIHAANNSYLVLYKKIVPTV